MSLVRCHATASLALVSPPRVVPSLPFGQGSLALLQAESGAGDVVFELCQLTLEQGDLQLPRAHGIVEEMVEFLTGPSLESDAHVFNGGLMLSDQKA